MARGIVAVMIGLGAVASHVLMATAAAPQAPSERVEHHLREVETLTRHFESMMTASCPQFSTQAEWDVYLDGEVERVVLLLAHLDQAWLEAKRTGDDDLRRTAKAPRRRADEARALVAKLQDCAGDHGARFAPLAVWRRVEREVPKKQAEIALP